MQLHYFIQNSVFLLTMYVCYFVTLYNYKGSESSQFFVWFQNLQLLAICTNCILNKTFLLSLTLVIEYVMKNLLTRLISILS